MKHVKRVAAAALALAALFALPALPSFASDTGGEGSAEQIVGLHARREPEVSGVGRSGLHEHGHGIAAVAVLELRAQVADRGSGRKTVFPPGHGDVGSECRAGELLAYRRPDELAGHTDRKPVDHLHRHGQIRSELRGGESAEDSACRGADVHGLLHGVAAAEADSNPLTHTGEGSEPCQLAAGGLGSPEAIASRHGEAVVGERHGGRIVLGREGSGLQRD